MKNTVILLISLFVFTGFGKTIAQDKSKTETVKIKTSAVCDECKDRIETALSYEKGIKDANLDTSNGIITVTYRPDKISVDGIRTAISKTGYDADDVKADDAAYDKLPKCCKKHGGKQG